MKHIIFLLLLFVSLISCEEKMNWEFKDEALNTIVVDGILTNIRRAHLIRITKPVVELNEKPEPVSGAIVLLSNGSKIDTLRESLIKPGFYFTDTIFRAVLNKIYRLRIQYQGKQYESFARMVPVTPFRKLSYAYDSDKDMFYIDSVTQNFSSKESAMYEIIIDWSHLPQYSHLPLVNRVAVVYYYTLTSIDISEVFAPEKERIYFPKGTRIFERKYSLSPKHAEFIRSLLSETDWRGGYFDITQANVRTNISNGGLGFFGVCTVIRDTITVK